MPAQADAPHKSARRSRRPPRKPVAATSSQTPSSQDAELSTDTGTETPSGQPTRILRRGDAIPELIPTVRSDIQPPQTPPRPKSMYAGAADHQRPADFAAPVNSEINKKTPRSQGRKQSGQVSPMPAANDIPISTPRQESATPKRDSMAPNRTIETPSKAYAGPTFHASPAASSLPMPKFFSKSVPNVDNSKSMKTMMEQEAPDASSSSEESPGLENAQPFTHPKAREESPLDIFFRADREAKARTGSAPNIPFGRNSQPNGLNPQSILQAPDRHHSRNNSAGGIFSLEMDGAAPEVPSGAGFPRNESNTHASAAAASPGLTSAEREEQRKARTIALKKLLYSPRPQIAHNNSTGQRPPSSKLRKEVSMPTSPEDTKAPELPATPTPSRVCDQNAPTNNYSSQHDYHVPPFPPFSRMNEPDRGYDTPFTENTTKSKSIEDDLRRILKIDVLGSDGVTGVRSQ